MSVRTTFLAAALLAAASAQASPLVDTGTPDGQAVGALLLDSFDSYAGQVHFDHTVDITAVATHLLGGAAGETFTLALYSDAATHAPGSLLYSTTVSYTADGWNGFSGGQWHVGAGNYWVAVEVGFADTLGSANGGALLDQGAPNPLSLTAFSAGGSYAATRQPLSFGLQVTAVPEPASMVLMLAGLGAIGLRARRRG